MQNANSVSGQYCRWPTFQRRLVFTLIKCSLVTSFGLLVGFAFPSRTAETWVTGCLVLVEFGEWLNLELPAAVWSSCLEQVQQRYLGRGLSESNHGGTGVNYWRPTGKWKVCACVRACVTDRRAAVDLRTCTLLVCSLKIEWKVHLFSV
jgi:hypothetical protein